MRALTLALVVTLTLAVAGCGDGDKSSSGYSGSPDPGSETVATPEPTPDPGCPERAPITVPVKDEWRGFLRLCESDPNRRLLVLENISNYALQVSADTSRVDITRSMPPVDDNDLAGLMVSRLNWNCGSNWCPVPPGGHVDARGNPAQVFVAVHDAMTVSVVFEKNLASVIASYLTPRVRRNAQTVADCAQNVGRSVNGQNWEEQFRYALTAAPSCNSLRKLLFGSAEDVEAGERSAVKLIGKAREFSQGTWVDVLVKARTFIR